MKILDTKRIYSAAFVLVSEQMGNEDSSELENVRSEARAIIDDIESDLSYIEVLHVPLKPTITPVK